MLANMICASSAMTAQALHLLEQAQWGSHPTPCTQTLTHPPPPTITLLPAMEFTGMATRHHRLQKIIRLFLCVLLWKCLHMLRHTCCGTSENYRRACTSR